MICRTASCRDRVIVLALALGLATVEASPCAVAAPPTHECIRAELRLNSSDLHDGAAIPLPGEPIGYAMPRTADGTRYAVVLVGPITAGRITRNSPELQAAIAELMATKDYRSLNLKGKSELKAIVERIREEQNARCEPETPVERPLLVRVDFDPKPSVTVMATDLPQSARSVVALDANSDGADEIYVEVPGGLLRIDDNFSVVISDPELYLSLENPRDVQFPEEQVAIRSPFQDEDSSSSRRPPEPALYIRMPQVQTPLLRVTGLGELRLYAPTSEITPWPIAAAVPLPVRSHADRALLSSVSPQVRRVEGPGDGSVLAAGPMPFGAHRLQTLLIDLGAPADALVREAWSRLPDDAGKIRHSGYLLLDGETYLWVWTVNEQAMQFSNPHDQLTLFRLTDDRTRSGGLPELTLDKADNFVRGLKLAQDVDGDGQQDFVVVSWDDGNVVRAFQRRPDHLLERSPRKQTLEFEGHPWFGSGDLDADGEAELLLVSSERLAMYDWRIERSGPLLAEESLRFVPRPFATATWSTEHQRSTTMLDVDNDGDADWITLLEDEVGNAYIELIRFRVSR